MSNPDGIIKINFCFFKLNIFVIMQETLDHIDLVFTDNSGLTKPVNKVHYSIDLPDLILSAFRNTNKNIRAEQWLENDLLTIAPLFLYPVQRAIVYDLLTAKKISHFLFPAWLSVQCIPISFLNVH